MSLVINNYELVNTIFIFLIGGTFGSIFASFYQLLIDRIPLGESIVGRSHCICKRQLSIHENIPIFSYFILLGKSKCCKSKIPPKHFLGEIAAFLIFGLISLLTNYYILIFLLLIWGILTFTYAKSKIVGQSNVY
jgi:prepilin signal peptidase PulO-like enzyme (type II secretory pathway)